MNKIMTILMMLLVTTLNASSAMVINLSHTDSRFEVTLPANPSTGYQWSIKNYDQGLLTLVSQKFIPSTKNKLPGASGTMQYTFELIKRTQVPKLTSLVFSYARPWDAENASMQTVTVNFSGKPVVRE